MSLTGFPAGDGAVVYVQSVDAQVPDAGSGGLSRAGAGERIMHTAQRTWEQSLDGMRAAAEGALRQLRGIDPPPSEVRVSFQVSINGTVGATLVSAGADAHLTVDVVWRAQTAETAEKPGE